MKRKLVEVTNDHNERLKEVGDGLDIPIKRTLQLILDWALPKFEQGGELAIRETGPATDFPASDFHATAKGTDE